MTKCLTESVDLLEQIKGRRIVRMVRLFCGDVNRFLEDFPKVRQQEIFASSGYSLFIQFEVVGWLAFAECEREISVVVWKLEGLPALKKYSDLEVDKISTQQYIECSDDKYSEPHWMNLVGQRVVELKIISLSVDRENLRTFKNERGLWIVMDNGMDMIIETSLAEKGIPGGMNVIRRNQIRSDFQGDLAFREVWEGSAD